MTGNSLPLSVQVSLHDWNFVRRRCAYLEAVLVQLLRDKSLLREWFPAGELAALRLSGLAPLVRPAMPNPEKPDDAPSEQPWLLPLVRLLHFRPDDQPENLATALQKLLPENIEIPRPEAIRAVMTSLAGS